MLAQALRCALVASLATACVGPIGDPQRTLAIPGADATDDGAARPRDASATSADPDAGTSDPRDAAAPPDRDARAPLDASAPRDAAVPCNATDCPPASRTRDQICAAWSAGQRETAPNGGFTKSDAMCDPGAVSQDGLDDAFRRLDLHRWLAGLGPAGQEPASNAPAQACALIAAWNPVGQQAHSPQPTATCYTAEGAGAAGASNIAWGNNTAASAIDQWFVDWGNESTFGHRRWLLNPPLGGVGIGAYQGGNNYGSAACITVFGGGGSAIAPDYVAYPPPGFVPEAIAAWVWTIQGRVPQANLAVSITARSTGMVMPSAIEVLQGGFGGSAGVRIDRPGWQPTRDETYQVRVTGDGSAAIEYELTPIACP